MNELLTKVLDAKWPQNNSILKFFDLAGVEKFKRRWARGERL
jgi:hypothetical protein